MVPDFTVRRIDVDHVCDSEEKGNVLRRVKENALRRSNESVQRRLKESVLPGSGNNIVERIKRERPIGTGEYLKSGLSGDEFVYVL